MTETMNQLGINKKDKHLLAAKSVLKNIQMIYEICVFKLKSDVIKL